MPNKAFSNLAAALVGASSVAQLSVSSSSVVTPGVYAAQIAPSESRKKRRRITADAPEVTANDVLDVPEVAANVLGALGTGEGALLLSTLSRARKQSVVERAQRVGKLVAAMRDGDPWIGETAGSGSGDPRVEFERWWNSLPPDLRAEKQVVLAAMESPGTWRLEERWWNFSLSTEMRADKDVVLAAIRAFRFRTWWLENWNSLPATLQAMPDVVEAAIEIGMIDTSEKWNSLPDGVRANKKVVLAAIRSPRRVFESEDWWDSLPAEVLRDKDAARAFISRDSDRPLPSVGALMLLSAPLAQIQQEMDSAFSNADYDYFLSVV
eukprot:g12933.t1